MKRQRMGYKAGKADFRRKASVFHTHPKNGLSASPVFRGGIRL